MPPELLPRDRKELFRERKNERSVSEGGGSNRWRDVRRPGGYGRGFPMLSEESFRGSGPSRSNDKMLDDESGRSLGKYGRSSRDNRGGPISQRGLNRHSSDAAAAVANSSLNGPASMQFDINDKRLVDDVLTCNQIDLKDTNDKSGGVSGSCTGQKVDGENLLSSIDWKTLKWTRSGSMSSRGSGLSHSSSSKSMGVDSIETKSNLRPQNASPLQSPSRDTAAGASPAAAGASPIAPTEETNSRKKPRLGWGEGLAKFEKKKVESPTETAAKNGMPFSENNREHGRSHVINVPDRSPRLAGLLSCTSPATPSSVACSSSPGVEDKSLGKVGNVETANLCGSPSESLNQCEGLSCNPVTLEEAPVANLCPSINELVQCNDQGSVDSEYVKSTALHKLLVLKADVSKRIEATESEIDSLETELKLLITDTRSDHPHPASSSSLPVVVGTASNLIPRPDALQTSGDLMKDGTYDAFEGELAEGKDEDIDSPGTATSKFSEPTDAGKSNSKSDIPKPVGSSWNVSACKSDSEVKSLVHAVEEEGTDTRPSQDASHMLPYNVGLQRDNVYDLIIASNKEFVHSASEVFSKLMPANLSSSHIPVVDYIPCLEINPLVEERFATRKRFMKFKERVITLKFRVFQHLWKEDLRLLSIKRSRSKPQKKFEFGTRMLPCGYQKHRASIRSRFSSPAGNLSLVPTTQVIDFASKLLEDSRTKVFRSALNMPSLILDNREKIMSRFISSNGLVEDPCSLETERCVINPWTSEEKEIFLDKLSVFGKDFRKIASFLDSKTTADCVEFYYKNHKSDCFQKAKKKPEFAENGKSYSKNTYLIASGKRWNRDSNAASLDLLGAASAIAANDDNDDALKNQKGAPRLIYGSSNSRTVRGDDVMSKRSSAINILGSERENVAADVLAGICGSLSSEAMSSCITSSIDVGEGYQDRKCQPMRLKKRRSVTPEVVQDVDEGICSDESCGEVDHADWTDVERSVFIQAVSSYGKDFAMISQCVRTKSSNQCKVFFSKARKCLGLDMMHPGSCSGGASLSDNADGGGGADTEDASLVETGSGVKSGSKTDDDLSLSSSKAVQTETSLMWTINTHPDAGKSKKINDAGELDVIVDKLSPEDVSAGSKDARLVLDGDNIEKSDGSESLAVKNLENGFGPYTKTRQDEAAESGSQGKAAVVQEVSDIVIPYAKIESGVDVDNCRAGAGTEFPLPGNSFCEKGLKVTPLSNGNVPLSTSTDLSATGILPGCEHRNPINLDAAPFSMLQTPVIQDPVVVQAEKSLNLTSNLVSGKTSNTQLKISVSSEDGDNKPLYQQSSMDHINPSGSLQAYPPSIPTRKALNGDIGSYKPTLSPSISKVDRNLNSHHLLPQDSYLPKSNGHGPKNNDMRSELVLSQDQLKENIRRTRPRCLSDSDQPTRKGDVKLFGQILSHPSTQQKPNIKADEKDWDAKYAKSSENSYNLKITPSQNLNGILASTKFDHSSYLGLRDMGLPARSFGYWDGKRIQTGLNSLPDSAILLAKYPAAFSNYPPSSSNVEQQKLHRIGDCNLNGVSVMPARELCSSNGVADFQAYMNCDGAKVQPFTVDLKQQQHRYYSEMQRQRRGSEFDGVSSVQQQRGMVALDVLGRGGILHGGGGPRNTVSDPVAAIRRHYAGEQYNGQMGNIIREEAWRSNGNVGR